MRSNTKVFLVESPANPLLEVTAIAAAMGEVKPRRRLACLQTVLGTWPTSRTFSQRTA